MLVLDTRAWIWRSDDPDRLGAEARRLVASEPLAISAISVWEVEVLVQRGRLSLDRPTPRWIAAALSDVATLAVTAEVALRAAQLRTQGLEGDPADGFIYAAALLAAARLVTKDSRLRAFDPRLTVW